MSDIPIIMDAASREVIEHMAIAWVAYHKQPLTISRTPDRRYIATCNATMGNWTHLCTIRPSVTLAAARAVEGETLNGIERK